MTVFSAVSNLRDIFYKEMSMVRFSLVSRQTIHIVVFFFVFFLILFDNFGLLSAQP